MGGDDQTRDDATRDDATRDDATRDDATRVRDAVLVDALEALADRPRDLEGERILARLRRTLAQVDAPPPRIGRFEVRGTLGAGAMGTVYRARDPELQRELAVKVLHAARDQAGALREARALARLSHPNAVTIYDVGEDRGAIFVAMELVRGTNLRAWLAAEVRSTRQIVDVLIDAGRGLAAAHEQGLIHGDFKPDNVLVGVDRVRVADFGLARLGARDETALDEPQLHGAAAPPRDASSTEQAKAEPERTTFAGTPAYMANELLDGARATAASDQFAFATTLFEALAKQRPHESSGRAESIETLRAALREGPQAGAALQRVPARVRRVVLRGLQRDPELRYPSMAALLADLDVRPGRRRLRLVLAAVVLVTALASGLVAYLQGRAHDPCAGAAERVTRAWDPQRAAAVQVAFARTGVARAQQTFDETQRAIEGYTRGWTRAYRRTCEATRVRGEQSDTLLDTHMRCLGRRLGRLAALTGLLAQLRSGAELIGARRAIDGLAPASSCLATEPSAAAEQALPDDATSRARVTALDSQLDRGWALYALGRYEGAIALAERIERELGTLDWPLARAKGLLFVGAVRGRAGAPGQAAPQLLRALEAAARARADGLVFTIWQRLLKDALFSGRHQRVVEWSHFAKAAAARVGATGAGVDAIVGEAQLLAGKRRLALGLLERASRALVAARAPGETIAIAFSNLGNAQLQLGQVAAAEASYREALRQARDQLGPEHPTLARYDDKLGRIARQKGQLQLALRHHRRALAMREAAFGPRDRAVASSLLELSRALLAADQPAVAERHLARALAIRESAYGPRHLRLAGILKTQGEAAWLAGHGPAARVFWQRAGAIRRLHSPAHGDLRRLDCLLALVPQTQAAGAAARAALASCR